MKKAKFAFFAATILSVIIFLCACSANVSPSSVTSLSRVGDILTWQAVSNATYSLTIGESTHDGITNTYYQLQGDERNESYIKISTSYIDVPEGGFLTTNVGVPSDDKQFSIAKPASDKLVTITGIEELQTKADYTAATASTAATFILSSQNCNSVAIDLSAENANLSGLLIVPAEINKLKITGRGIESANAFNLSVKFEGTRCAELELCDVRLQAASLTKGTETPQITLQAAGNLSVITGGTAGAVIVGSNIDWTPSKPASSAHGSTGKSATTAIKAEYISVGGNKPFSVAGGRGGRGGDGRCWTFSHANGGNGGSGGDAVTCTSLFVNLSSSTLLSLTGGTGGAGGSQDGALGLGKNGSKGADGSACIGEKITF